MEVHSSMYRSKLYRHSKAPAMLCTNMSSLVAQTASSSSGLEVPHIVSLHMGANYNVHRLSREVHLFSLLL